MLRLPVVMLPAAWGPSLECWQQGEEAPAAAQQAASGRRQLPCHLVVAGCCQAFLRRLLLPATASHCGQTGGVADLPMELALLLMRHPSPLLLLLLLLLGNHGGWGAQPPQAPAVAMRPAQPAEANPMGGRHAAAAVPAGGRQEVGLALPTATSQAAAVVAAAVALAAAAAVTAAVPVPARVHLDAKRAAGRQQLWGNTTKNLGASFPLLC